MKKVLFIALCCIIAACATAQTKKVYCQLLGWNTNVLGLQGKVKVEVDFGGKKSMWGNDGRDLLIDENGKDIKFNSMVEAMNYMGSKGWTFEAAYTVTIASQNVIHWLLSKDVAMDDDGKEGIKQRRDKDSKEDKPKEIDDIYAK